MQPELIAIPVIITIGSFVTLLKWMTLRQARHVSPDALLAVEQRLARLEVAVDDMSAAFAQVSEGQQFLTKLLAERAPGLPAAADLPRATSQRP
jgi:hypothetical protein